MCVCVCARERERVGGVSTWPVLGPVLSSVPPNSEEIRLVWGYRVWGGGFRVWNLGFVEAKR